MKTTWIWTRNKSDGSYDSDDAMWKIRRINPKVFALCPYGSMANAVFTGTLHQCKAEAERRNSNHEFNDFAQSMEPDTESIPDGTTARLWGKEEARQQLTTVAQESVQHRLCIEVYEAVVNGCNSLEEQHLGADLAYLMGAILKGSECEWPRDRPIVQLLGRIFSYEPGKSKGFHPVWDYIKPDGPYAVTPGEEREAINYVNQIEGENLTKDPHYYDHQKTEPAVIDNTGKALPTMSQVEFSIECMPETESYVGNCSAIDKETDRANEQWIREQLEAGNQWAWCIVKVKAGYHFNGSDFYGYDCLGGCSYENEAGFKGGGYYEDMKKQAYNNLMELIRESVDA